MRKDRLLPTRTVYWASTLWQRPCWALGVDGDETDLPSALTWLKLPAFCEVLAFPSWARKMFCLKKNDMWGVLRLRILCR